MCQWRARPNKSVIKKFKRRKVYARFRDNIWAADLVEMRSLSSFNQNVKYLLCVREIFSENPWVKPLKDKNAKTVLHGFIEVKIIVNESKRKPNKLWVDQGKEFLDRFVLDNNDILLYSTHTKSKSVVAEKFLKTL